jgi:GTP-binding protein Era
MLTAPAPAAEARVRHNARVSSEQVSGDAPAHRSGFGCLVGRPNVGKSTLTTALVGAKVAITSQRPQTTRHAVRGIVNRPDAQLVVVDTPGMHRPRTLLGERLDDVVRTTWAEVDVIACCLPADEKVGPGDRFIIRELSELRRTPVLAVVTKSDRVGKGALADKLVEVSTLADFADIVPVAAVTGYQVDLLADLMIERLPAGPRLYADGELTDEPELVMIAELIREAALEGVRDELPHSIAVTVDEMNPRTDSDLVDIFATIYVERPSQKAIVLGPGGSRLKDVGSRSRRQIEALLGTRTYLNLHISVLKDWQRDPRHLRRLGF